MIQAFAKDLDIRLDTDIHAQLFVIVFGRPFVKQILHEMVRVRSLS